MLESGSAEGVFVRFYRFYLHNTHAWMFDDIDSVCCLLRSFVASFSAFCNAKPFMLEKPGLGLLYWEQKDIYQWSPSHSQSQSPCDRLEFAAGSPHQEIFRYTRIKRKWFSHSTRHLSNIFVGICCHLPTTDATIRMCLKCERIRNVKYSSRDHADLNISLIKWPTITCLKQSFTNVIIVPVSVVFMFFRLPFYQSRAKTN